MIGGFQYANSAALTITLASLANSATAGAISAAVDNSVDKFMDVMIQVKFKLATGTPAADQSVYVYAYGSEDGSTYPDGITGSAGAFTPRVPTCISLLQVISAATVGGLTYVGQPVPLAIVFGGTIPRKWGIFIKNTTNLAFTAVEADHGVRYTGLTILSL
jgi:hypothetical protein